MWALISKFSLISKPVMAYSLEDVMNKSELIEQLSVKKDISNKRAEDVVSIIFSSLTEAMVVGDRIEIRGLGSFVIKDYTTYTGRNPKTGESITVRPKKLPFFKVGKELKERILG
jgi:integration host factor subunit beta